MTTADQTAVLDFLGQAATHGGARVQRIDTHAASVFLAGERALKVKRAVIFPFLDYSTLAKREAACRAELDVNRPFAPQIYKRVVPITRASDGSLAIGGQGAPVEWAVEMHRFDETQTLDHLADAGKLDDALADALGRAAAQAHERAPAAAPGPWIKSLARIIDQNDAELRSSPSLFGRDDVRALTAASHAALTTLHALLSERGRLGLIRRCHGDLHLGNIVLIGGEPVLFDAIEFDPLIATGDVLYDLAFLLMDLIERGLTGAATIVLNRYLTETRRDEDLDALALLPLFMSVRAAIRAKVTAARQGDDVTRLARDYFTLALRLIAPPPPRLVAVGGLSGTGKSVLARALAPFVPPLPGAVVLRSDVERKLLFGAAETERLPPNAYEPDMTASVYARLAGKARRALAAGHSVIVDAVYAAPAEREAIAATARSLRVPFTGLFLTAGLETRLARVGRRTGDASDADVAVARRQDAYDLGTLDWIGIDASGTPGDTRARARAALGS
ncbi:MAG: AAA family ATPase [Pseudolabrys sp.]|jgi:aminoglycoside phosphotransferase family enzyme/predicted kinase|nr:AAA family ATPase [Pseudolabrys sp.]